MNDNSVAPGGQAYPPLEATVARARNGRVLAKSVVVDGSGRYTKAGSYDNASIFDFERLAVRDLAELAAVLTALSEDRAACLLHGRARAEGGPQRRRFHDWLRADGTVEPATIADAPSALLCLDIDDCPPLDPDVLAAMTPEQVFGYAMACTELPECFWARPSILQLTGSHGIDPGAVRVRLFFALDRALTWREREALVGRARVDRSVFHPVQCVYSARPIFTGGVDPHPERIFFINTPFDERVPVPDDLVAIDSTKGASSTAGVRASAQVEGTGWRRFLDAAEAHFFIECQSAVGSFVAIEGPDADPTPLFEAIDKMLDEKARPARGAEYVARRKADARAWHRRCAAAERVLRDPRRVEWGELPDDVDDQSGGTFIDVEDLRRQLAAEVG